MDGVRALRPGVALVAIAALVAGCGHGGPVTAVPRGAPNPVATMFPAPSQASSPTPPRTTLRRGDESPKVLALQQQLVALGYWMGTPDGVFGTLTEQAVWALQKAG